MVVTLLCCALIPSILLYVDVGGILLGSYFRWEFSTPVDRERRSGTDDLIVAPIIICGSSVDSTGLHDMLDEIDACAEGHIDSDSRRLQITFMFGVPNPDPSALSILSEYCRAGLGEIECLLPCDISSLEDFREQLPRIVEVLHTYGWARTADSQVRFAVLRNQFECVSADADYRSQIRTLHDLGCYVDLTFPCVGSSCQPGKVNSICLVSSGADDPFGEACDLRAGEISSGDLLLVSGPFLIDWTDWRLKYRPFAESGRLTPAALPDRTRAQSWLRARVHVTGQPNWIFVKLIIDDVVDADAARTICGGLHEAFESLEESCSITVTSRLHFVTAREMYNIIRAAEAGRVGDAGQFRDYLIKPYEATSPADST